MSDCGEKDHPKLLIAGRQVFLTDDCPIVKALIRFRDRVARDEGRRLYQQNTHMHGCTHAHTHIRTYAHTHVFLSEVVRVVDKMH